MRTGGVGAAALVLLATALVGCAGGRADKAGGTAPLKPVVLSLANVNSTSWELDAYAAEVRRRSHGALRIAFANEWGHNRPDVETKLIRDVAAGKAELGWAGTRAWDVFGSTTFDALHAPFLVDSYALEEAVLASPLASRMTRRLHVSRLVAVGVLPGELRRPFGVSRPLLSPGDYRGLRIGTSHARAARAAFRALGARPTTFFHDPTLPLSRVDGLEFPLSYFEQDKYDDEGRFATANVVFWPRPLVVFANARAYARLTPAQRGVLREAARAAVPATIRTIERHERRSLVALCERGRLQFVSASPAQVAAVRAATAKVRAAADARTRRDIAAIERMRARLGAPGDPPLRCPAVSSEGGAIPDGTYVNVTTAADARRARIPKGDPLYADLPIRHTLVVRGHDFVQYQTRLRDGHRETGLEGTYSSYRGKLRFATTRETLLPFAWSFHGRTLRFFDLPFDGGGYYGAEFSPPFTKVR